MDAVAKAGVIVAGSPVCKPGSDCAETIRATRRSVDVHRRGMCVCGPAAAAGTLRGRDSAAETCAASRAECVVVGRVKECSCYQCVHISVCARKLAPLEFMLSGYRPDQDATAETKGFIHIGRRINLGNKSHSRTCPPSCCCLESYRMHVLVGLSWRARYWPGGCEIQ